MNRQEAYEFIKGYLDNVFHQSNDYDTYSHLRDCADTLAPPEPDPGTGLLPCGCGGKAIPVRLPHPIKTLTCVACETCFVTTPYLEDDEAKDVWNRAMGGKGGVE